MEHNVIGWLVVGVLAATLIVAIQRASSSLGMTWTGYMKWLRDQINLTLSGYSEQWKQMDEIAKWPTSGEPMPDRGDFAFVGNHEPEFLTD